MATEKQTPRSTGGPSYCIAPGCSNELHRAKAAGVIIHFQRLPLYRKPALKRRNVYLYYIDNILSDKPPFQFVHEYAVYADCTVMFSLCDYYYYVSITRETKGMLGTWGCLATEDLVEQKGRR